MSAVHALLSDARQQVAQSQSLNDVQDLITRVLTEISQCECVHLLRLSKSNFETVDSGRTSPTPLVISVDSSLAKWLRVNDIVLPVPDRNDVVADLPASESGPLRNAGARFCVPLSIDEELEGIAVLSDSRKDYRSPSSAVAELGEAAPVLTRAWVDALYQAEERVRDAAAYRTEQLTTTGQLAASVAHEVRNPLAALRSIVQLVRDAKPTPERQANLLTEVLREVDRIDDHVAGLLGLARRHESSVAVHELTAIASAALKFMETQARQKGIELRASLDTKVSAIVDASEFRQVLLNIFLNASQASASKGVIEISSECEELNGRALARIVVRDAGSGMDRETADRAFDGFFTTKPEGTGLGLWLSRNLMRRHNGDLRIESEPGRGTTVILELPLSESHGPDPRH